MNTKGKTMPRLPGKDCGLCGSKTCDDFGMLIERDPSLIERCVHLHSSTVTTGEGTRPHAVQAMTWKDHLGRDFDFVLEKFPGEPGPRETILLFNPVNVEKLGLKKGDVIFGRPGWISCGCPVTHAGVIAEEPDYFNGTVTWHVTGPLLARERGIDIGYYNTTAYEGLVNISRSELKIGMRYYFLPRYCMLQWRHCGLMNSMGKTPSGMRVRLEGLFIG